MLRELKRVWSTHKYVIIISILIYIFLYGLVFVYLKDYYPKGNSSGLIKIRKISQILVILFTIFSIFYTYSKKSVVELELNLPRTRLKYYLNRFIPYLIVMLLLVLIFKSTVRELTLGRTKFSFVHFFDHIYHFSIIEISWEWFCICFLIFTTLFFFNIYRYWVFIVPPVILTWELIFPVITYNPIINSYSIHHNWNISLMFFSTLAALILFFFKHRKKDTFQILVILISIFTYSLVSLGNRVNIHYNHWGRPLQMSAHGRYITVLKHDPRFKRKNILYDLENKKSIPKVWLGKLVYSWDPEFLLFSGHRYVYLKIQEKIFVIQHSDFDISRYKYEQKCLNKSKNLNFIHSGYFYVIDLEKNKIKLKLKLDKVKSLRSSQDIFSLLLYSKKYFCYLDKNGLIQRSSCDEIVVEDGKTYYFYLEKKNQLFDNLHNEIFHKYHHYSYIGGLLFSKDPYGKLKVLYKGKFRPLEIDNIKSKNIFFDKYIYMKDNEIYLGQFDKGIICKQNFPEDYSKKFFLHEYKDELYLFLFSRNPILVYKFENNKWEFYDQFN